MDTATLLQPDNHVLLPTTGAPRPRRSVRAAGRQVRVRARGLASHIQTRDTSIPGLPVENISLGGLFVRCAAALEPGTRVMIQIVRPGLKRAIELTGRVASVVSPADARARGLIAGMGIDLDCLDQEAEKRLGALIDELVAAPVAAPVARREATANESAPAPILDLAEAMAKIDAQHRRIEQLEAELERLRRAPSRGDVGVKSAA